MVGFLNLAWAEPLVITFTPEESKYSEAAAEYSSIWDASGDDIISELEKAFGVSLPYRKLEVIVFEGISMFDVNYFVRSTTVKMAGW